MEIRRASKCIVPLNRILSCLRRRICEKKQSRKKFQSVNKLGFFKSISISGDSEFLIAFKNCYECVYWRQSVSDWKCIIHNQE